MTVTTGRPVWIDYGTPQAQAARDFYTGLFGWILTDQGEEFGHYNLISNGAPDSGNTVGGFVDMSSMPGGQQQGSAWTIYLGVDDAARRAAVGQAAGGSSFFDPMPVGSLGTMGLLGDTAGGSVGIWQPGSLSGYDFTMRPGSPVWFELMSTDFAASCAFYRDVFDFDLVAMGDTGSGETDASAPLDSAPYATNGANGEGGSGICNAKVWLPDGAPSYWRVYFGVADCDAACARIIELGGQITDGPVDSPFGRVATAVDQLGATFQINQAPPGLRPMPGAAPGGGPPGGRTRFRRRG